MEVVSLDLTTAYDDVAELAADALVNKDDRFKFDSQGNLEGLYIYDTPNSATLIEMDDFLFLDVYYYLDGSEDVPKHTRTLLDFIAHGLDEAA